MPAVFDLNEPHWVWRDLPRTAAGHPDIEASYVAAKICNPYKNGMPFPSGGLIIRFKHPSIDYEVIPTTDGRFGVRNAATGHHTIPPFGIEGPTLEEISPATIRKHCGINEQDRRIASLEAQVRQLQAALAERQQTVEVRRA